MAVADSSPTLARVLSALPAERKKILFEHIQAGAFHRGRQWFGTGMHVPPAALAAAAPGNFVPLMAMTDAPCPVAAAFHVERDTSPSGWFSAKINENLMMAIKHIVEFAGQREDGMEQYLKELENTDPIELYHFVVSQFMALSDAAAKDDQAAKDDGAVKGRKRAKGRKPAKDDE
ncbi:hypothetical protein GOA98_24585 [Sinorhizobium meliloti]|nr:hypothetical protein [Sinorhizobium meliloti]